MNFPSFLCICFMRDYRQYKQNWQLFKITCKNIVFIIIMLKKIFGLGFSLSFATSILLDQEKSKITDTKRHAICILYPNNSKVAGIASFSQDRLESPTKITFAVNGLNPNAKHGVHIHEFGDLTDGCHTAGEHFNPHGKRHGGPQQNERHLGDMGNLFADQQGNAFMSYSDKMISLYGQYSVLGRSVVVHAEEDDLGKTNHPQSSKTGNSGSRVACGVIGLAKDFKTANSENIQKI